MSKPQLVLIPGAWHTPEAFSVLIPKLEAHGYTVHTTQLPSVDAPADNVPTEPNKDIEAVRSLVTKAIGAGNDVIVAPHSWGGIVAGSALSGLGKKEREAKGEKGGVMRTAYMCAFMAPQNFSLSDALQGQIPDWWYIDGPYARTRPHAANVFYNDLPEAQQQKWYAGTRTQASATMTAKAAATSWMEIPTSYLLCENDLAIPPQAQEGMTEMAKGMGGEVEVTRVKSGHSPFLSVPDEVVAWLRRVAGEVV